MRSAPAFLSRRLRSLVAAAATTTAQPDDEHGREAGAGRALHHDHRPPRVGPAPAASLPKPPLAAGRSCRHRRVKLDPRRTYTVTIVTNCGTFAFRARRQAVARRPPPRSTRSSGGLLRRPDLPPRRGGFVIQGGDPTGTGGGGPGYTVVEAPPQHIQYVARRRRDGEDADPAAPARPAASSSSSPPTRPNPPNFTPDYALLGKVVSGQSVVDTIGSLPTNANEMPIAARRDVEGHGRRLTRTGSPGARLAARGTRARRSARR